MGKVKKQKKAGGDKAAAAKAKKAKVAKKGDKKETKILKKKGGKDKEEVMDEADLIATLVEYRERWALEHKVTGELRGRSGEGGELMLVRG